MQSAEYLTRYNGVPHIVWKKVDIDLKDKTIKQKATAYTSIIKDWLKKLAKELKLDNNIYESSTIIYFTYFPPKIAEDRLSLIIDVKDTLIDLFGDIVPDTYIGKNLILEFEDPDMYYHYMSYFEPPVKKGKKILPPSGGCMCSRGYLQIVLNIFAKRDLSRIIAHELSHLLLAYYHIPSWLNEGIAMNAETLTTRSNQFYLSEPDTVKHLQYWNKNKFKSFLDGKTINGPRTSGLAYGLSYMMVRDMLIKKVRIDRVLKKYKECGDISVAVKEVSGRDPVDFTPPMIRERIIGE
jgi:hypothetical protein